MQKELITQTVSKLLDIHHKLGLISSVHPDFFVDDTEDYSEKSRALLWGIRLNSQDISREIYELIRSLDDSMD